MAFLIWNRNMSDNFFINKCECCEHFCGSKYREQAWGYYHDVDCEKGMNSTVGKGCHKFYPIRLGCQADCYLANKECSHKTLDVLRGNVPCYQYAKVDYESNDDGYSYSGGYSAGHSSETWKNWAIFFIVFIIGMSLNFFR